MSEMPSLSLIITTFSEEAVAHVVVRQLLEERLVVCGTMLPGARSFYHWKGKLEESGELVVVLKTEPEIASCCMERLAELHPYEVPEIVQITPEAVSAPYADWVRDSLRKSQ